MTVDSGCGWQHIANSHSAEEAIQWGQRKRQKQRELSDQLLGKDKTAVLEMWGKPDYVKKDVRFPRYYVGYYDNADQKFLEEVFEEWTYIFPRKRIPLVSDRIGVELYFKDDKVVFVGL